VKLTADTITDADIRALLESKPEQRVRVLCKLALNDAPTYLGADVVRRARARVAEYLNEKEKP
jgi:hypothetical protein